MLACASDTAGYLASLLLHRSRQILPRRIARLDFRAPRHAGLPEQTGTNPWSVHRELHFTSFYMSSEDID